MRKTSATSQFCRISFRFFAALALAAALFTTTPVRAAVTYTGGGAGNDAGEANSASVTFDISISGTTTDLVVTLSNTSVYTPNDDPDILTAVFFTLAGNPTLTKISGVLNVGSVVVENGTNWAVAAGADIGGSWTYKTGLSGAPGGANQGISSAGFGLFGTGNVFPDAAIPGDSPIPDGVGGGLTTTIDGGSGDGLHDRPLIQYSAVFTLDSVPASLSLSDISGVSFQYGTDLTKPNYPGTLIPEPSSIALTMGGLGLLGFLIRKRR